ncbi:hypothetical protein ADIS_4121 [Lunatimonas lonarensis]|uniref:Uncharacterized protein n=1 Tax=Lunatimonas lonarensis TaxID=1232681 RepID=R7ZMV9_9BACT|nr:hypothetical protein ADIS_4121 [Lunatimonas lonarensis]
MDGFICFAGIFLADRGCLYLVNQPGIGRGSSKEGVLGAMGKNSKFEEQIINT